MAASEKWRRNVKTYDRCWDRPRRWLGSLRVKHTIMDASVIGRDESLSSHVSSVCRTVCFCGVGDKLPWVALVTSLQGVYWNWVIYPCLCFYFPATGYCNGYLDTDKTVVRCWFRRLCLVSGAQNRSHRCLTDKPKAFVTRRGWEVCGIKRVGPSAHHVSVGSQVAGISITISISLGWVRLAMVW